MAPPPPNCAIRKGRPARVALSRSGIFARDPSAASVNAREGCSRFASRSRDRHGADLPVSDRKPRRLRRHYALAGN